jgi:hypothetical protein
MGSVHYPAARIQQTCELSEYVRNEVCGLVEPPVATVYIQSVVHFSIQMLTATPVGTKRRDQAIVNRLATDSGAVPTRPHTCSPRQINTIHQTFPDGELPNSLGPSIHLSDLARN